MSIVVYVMQCCNLQGQSSLYEDIDAKLVFMLSHKGRPQLVFHAESYDSAQRYVPSQMWQVAA